MRATRSSNVRTILLEQSLKVVVPVAMLNAHARKLLIFEQCRKSVNVDWRTWRSYDAACVVGRRLLAEEAHHCVLERLDVVRVVQHALEDTQSLQRVAITSGVTAAATAVTVEFVRCRSAR